MDRRSLLILTLLTACAFGLRFLAFCHDGHPLGTDGYYYVVQATDWWQHGLHVPDSSWMLRLLGAVGTFVDPVLATKLTAAGLAAACVPAAWWLGEKLENPWLLAGWAAGSPTLTHLAVDFPKNLALAAPLLLGVAAVLRGRWGVALGCAVLVGTAHRLGAVILVLGTLSAGLARFSTRVFWGLCGLGVGLVLLSALPGTLHPGEGFRWVGQVVPGDGLPPFCWFESAGLHTVERLELILASLGVGVALARWRRPEVPLLLPVLLLAALPLWRADSLDLGYRLSLVAPLLAAPLWVGLAPRLSPSLSFLLLPLATIGLPRHAPPYERYEAVIDAIPRPLPKLLIAHQGLNFLYDHRTGEEAMAWAPDPHLDPRTVGRLAWGIRESEWAAFEIERTRLDSQYSYLTEPEWEKLKARAARDGDDDLRDRIGNRRNPSRVRPGALLRGRATLPESEGL